MTVYIILTVILVFLVMYLFLKNDHLKFDNKHLKQRKNDAENTASIYFNTLIQYRDVLIKHNLTVPDPLKFDFTDESPDYSIDSILDEIAEKGIDNISQDKLNFLKNKQDGKNS